MAVTETNIASQACIMLGELVIDDLDTDTTKRATTLKAIFEIKRNYLLRKFHWKFAIKRATLTVIDNKLNFDAETVDFVIGEVVTGATGEGTIEYILRDGAAGTLWLSNVTTGFIDDETITGDIAGSADADGVEYSPTPVNEYDYIYALPSDYIQLIELYPNYLSYRIESNFILSGESTTLDIRYTYKVTNPEEMDALFIETLAALLARESAVAICDSIRQRDKMDEAFEDKLTDARFAGSIEDDLEEIKADNWLTQRM